ncbi:hypothetical protein [Limnoglobus roseus]|uniref:Uncharacterized protein n=1 Tax=Limnoglobus roseus TaxID=2598579 RepID=A0A5C1A8V6_9BACT|nr:hypothetical protein [Limnoglobus roseus]QEL14222.1 hypothetical protein PX52LOC_01092 [Limnoglobus roseus]
MSTLGKILLFVNLLLAVGVLYLAAQDRKKRTELNDSAVKYQFVIGGLPVEPIKDASVGEPGTDTLLVSVTGPNNAASNILVSKKLVESLYTGADNAFAGAGVPNSQVDLVNAVYTKMVQDLDAVQGDSARVQSLCGYLDNKTGQFQSGKLLVLAETFEERAAIRSLSPVSATPLPPEVWAANLKDARDRLKRKFDAVTQASNPDQPEQARKTVEELKTKILANPKDADLKRQLAALSAGGPNGPTASDAERRMKIAQLLMQVNPSPDWQKKVVLTVGLKAYQLAIIEQTGRLESMLAQTRDARFVDQQNFDVEYEQLKSFALENSKLVDQQIRVVDGLKATLATDELLFTQRQELRKQLMQELAVLTTSVNEKLAKQQKTEKSLFEVQQQVGLTLRETSKLEGDLRQKEISAEK